MMIKNIIFDWSGVLSDDFDSCYCVVNAIFAHYHMPQLSHDEMREEFVLPYMDFWNKYLDLPKEELNEAFMEQSKDFWRPEPYPKAKEVLEYLRKKGIRMVVLSSHDQPNIDMEVQQYGFGPYFSEVLGSVHDKRDEILALMKRHNFTPDDTAYVGDMVHDIETGKMAGVITIGITGGYQSREKLESVYPDFLIDDLEELKEIV